MKIFTSVAALEAATLTANQLVETKRYYDDVDGGQARYLIKTAVDYGSTPDGYGDHELVNGNVAVLQYEGAINVKWFGAKGDGVTDDTAATQAAINVSCTNKTSVDFAGSGSASWNYKITTKLSVTEAIKIFSSAGKRATILCVGCDGLEVASGIKKMTIDNLTLAQSTRHTDTPNTYTAITLLGDTNNRPFWNTYTNLFIDGFGLVFKTNWMWESNITNVKTAYCGGFIQALGITTNNKVTHCGVSGNGLLLDFKTDADNTKQGWIIKDNLFDCLSTGNVLDAKACSYFTFSNNICDFIGTGTGFFIRNGTSIASFAWHIDNNYVAFNVNASNGIRCLNSISLGVNLDTGHRITNNDIFAYGTNVLTNGILLDGTEENRAYISGNTIEAGTYDLNNSASTNSIIVNNKFIGIGFYTTERCTYYNNTGSYLPSKTQSKQVIANNQIIYGSVTPTSGTYAVGDIMYYISPAAAGHIGEVCTTAGTPGTWKTFGAISA